MSKILVIGDPHARHENDLRRFTALSNFIIDKRPDHIVCIGDLADMTSLSKYDIGTLHAEGRRYHDDIVAANRALELATAPVKKFSDRMRTKHRRRYDPKWYITIGNHEHRIHRASVENPALFGHISLSDINFERWEWSVSPFLEPLTIEDIVFQHYFTSGLLGRPIGGHNHARTLLTKNHMSSVCGHSHLRDYSEDTNAVGGKIFGLVVGCYDEGGGHHWTTEEDRWWSGLTMLNEAQNGGAEPAFFTIDYINKNYL